MEWLFATLVGAFVGYLLGRQKARSECMSEVDRMDFLSREDRDAVRNRLVFAGARRD